MDPHPHRHRDVLDAQDNIHNEDFCNTVCKTFERCNIMVLDRSCVDYGFPKDKYWSMCIPPRHYCGVQRSYGVRHSSLAFLSRFYGLSWYHATWVSNNVCIGQRLSITLSSNVSTFWVPTTLPQQGRSLQSKGEWIGPPKKNFWEGVKKGSQCGFRKAFQESGTTFLTSPTFLLAN